LGATRPKQECLARGWPEVPEWVFCSAVGTSPDPWDVQRSWYRVRRLAQKQGIRPLELHCARHTWATFASPTGKSIRWVAEQLGRADPGFRLRVYAHAMREEESDLSFAVLGSSGVSGRLYASPIEDGTDDELAKSAEVMARREGFDAFASLTESNPRLTSSSSQASATRSPRARMARREGLEPPTLRFEESHRRKK
jgi:hypothetical protein